MIKETTFKVYWTYGTESYGEEFKDMAAALAQCQSLRRSGRSFVTMVSEDPNRIGHMGVDSVEQGKLPNGDIYHWKKRRE